MVINTTFRLAPWADVLYACDEAWWRIYFAEVSKTFPGELWSTSEAAKNRFGTNWIHGHSKLGGLSKEKDMIHTGKNSGFQAIGLAHIFGAKRIILVGFDFQHDHGRVHWHGNHPQPLGNAASANLGKWCREMEILASDLRKVGTEVINASRRTALKCFPRMALEDVL